MLIPGLPPAGSMNDRVKINKTVKPLAEAEFLHDLVTESRDRRQRDLGHFPERRGRKRAATAPEVAGEPPAESLAGDETTPHELPDKGLLVDIEV
ncbi:hypothetical protein [Halopseudomonas salegens]|uniref:Uncharacterized protein n=1 Tax=Halopseudomonas salegens TaxID=1434072 RepID=A0A1H2GEI1_9GAMM|nr:hypothetical protein [Halopseudomonas salegens]SDU17808.1 hypothetical protein SAMN05216210_2235 [Halopseudomonas salegens]